MASVRNVSGLEPNFVYYFQKICGPQHSLAVVLETPRVRDKDLHPEI